MWYKHKQFKPNKTKCLPVFVRENKSWCVSWLSVVRQEVLIDALGWTSWHPLWVALQGLWLYCHSSSRLFLREIIWFSPSLFILFLFSIIAIIASCQCQCALYIDSYKSLELGKVKRRGIEQEWWTQWCRRLTLQDVIALHEETT